MTPSPPLLFRGVLLVAASTFATVTVGKAGAASVLPQARPAAHATATPASSRAPADEYFGRLKMSVLGLRHRVDELAKRYGERTISDDDLLHDAQFVQEAIDGWRVAYPHDPWLPQTSFHLAQLYMTVQTEAARTRAKTMFAYTATYFPTSHQGHLSRVRLAQGFPPLHHEAPVSPAPQARSSDAPVPAPSAAEAPTTARSPGGADSPVPQPSSTVAPR